MSDWQPMRVDRYEVICHRCGFNRYVRVNVGADWRDVVAVAKAMHRDEEPRSCGDMRLSVQIVLKDEELPA